MADRTVQINSFKYGLDTRRDALASLPGTLQLANNCYVDAGGEINKRKAFVPVDSANIKLPVGCFGLQDTDTGLMTFGSAATPAGLPAGVQYQQLNDPYGFETMTSVVFSCAFLGKPFVVASFTGPNNFVFYNGSLVGQITDGILKFTAPATVETISQMASDLAVIVNRNAGPNDLGNLGWFAHANVTALPYDGVHDLGYQESALAGSVLIASPPSVHFTPTIKNNNSANGTLGVKLIDQNYPGKAAVAAVAAFTLNAGTNGTVTVTAPAKADGTGTAAISGGAVNFDTSLAQTCADIAAAINNNTFVSGYFAAVQGTTVTVYAPASFGAFQNVTPHNLIVDTTGDITTTSGTPFSQVTLNVTLSGENIKSFGGGIFGATRVATASISGLSPTGTAVFSWSQVNQADQDIVSPANFFGISATVGASITIAAAFNPGVNNLTGRFRCTVTDTGNNTKATLFFTVTMTSN